RRCWTSRTCPRPRRSGARPRAARRPRCASTRASARRPPAPAPCWTAATSRSSRPWSTASSAAAAAARPPGCPARHWGAGTEGVASPCARWAGCATSGGAAWPDRRRHEARGTWRLPCEGAKRRTLHSSPGFDVSFWIQGQFFSF
ncbi:unnamed protein product, partial [Heterosigma akashiwo]